MLISAPTDSLSSVLALGNDSATSTDIADGVRYQRWFGLLWQPQPSRRGELTAVVNGHEYLRAELTAAFSTATSVRAVLRTLAAFADSSRVLVSFQLRDQSGSVLVARSGLEVDIVVRFSELQAKSAHCITTGLSSPGEHYLGHCSVPTLPVSWFSAAGTASVALELRYNHQLVATSAAGTIVLHAAPSWYGREGSILSSAGALVVLPISPVYALEQFELKIYAHTGGYELETWGLELHIDPLLLEYVAHEQSDRFNGVVYSPAAAARGIHRFQAVGTRAATLPAQVTTPRHLQLALPPA